MVEALIVIVIIGILVSITAAAYSKVQRDARDSTRRGNATIITEALEEYYRKNGEYPSVRNLVNNYADNTGTAVAARLDISPGVLKMPAMPASATNALYSAVTPINDYITYTAVNAVDNAGCQTLLTGGCDEFTLKYIEESGTTVTIDSRHKGHPTS